MFNNVGGKLKAFAVFILIVSCISIIALGCNIIWNTNFNTFLGRAGSDSRWGIAIGVQVGGFLGAWITALSMYGIGEAVENTEQVKNYIRRLNPKVDVNEKKTDEPLPEI